jgi:hypothetical protein
MDFHHNIGSLVGLAHCFARPVRRGWLPLEVADACLVLAVCRLDVPELDVLGVWRDLQDTLRRAVQ